MISRRITSADLVEVTGFSRHKLRSLLKDLPGYSDRDGLARIAREYTRHDLTVIAVCCELEERCGLRRDLISQLVPEIRKALAGPRSVAIDARLIVIPGPPSAQYVDGPFDGLQGTVLPLKDIFRRIDAHLLGDQAVEPDGQRTLDLGPVPIATVRGSQASNNDGEQSGATNAAR
jgi:hypothetical protein